MLTNVLSFNERSKWSVAATPDREGFESALELLHKNDRAILKYFGLDRSELLVQVDQCFSGGVEGDAPIVAVLEEAIRIIVSLPPESEGVDTFNIFSARCYGYFRYIFESDSKYTFLRCWINVETFLSSVRPYITTVVTSVSEKSLVHHLNSRLVSGDDLDLNTFNQDLDGESLVCFLTSYPVLTRLLLSQIEDMVAYLYKIIGHFASDIEQIETAFSLPGRCIDSIVLGLGDAHANGETVCCLQVAGQSLFYKPKSNHEAIFYRALLESLYERTGNACFDVYSPIMVSLDNRCWIENIENLACVAEFDLPVFYERLGAQVAVIHALNGIDFHCENIIARGSSPVMIDLECLFTSDTIGLKVDMSQSRALFKTIRQISQSVFSTCFVPYVRHSDNDYSGLSQQEHFVINKRTLVHENGLYRLKQVQADDRPSIRHLPVFEGERRSVVNYKDAFFLGFERGYDEMMTRHDAVLELLTQHAGHLSTRVLIKNTQRYADFIEMILHPRFTQCGLRHELLLATLWSDVNDALGDCDVPRHEINDLNKANIPCFFQPLLSDQLFNAHGQLVAPLAIEVPFDSCRRKLENLSPKDKAFQIHILQMCLFPAINELSPLNRRHCLQSVPDLSHARYLEGAMHIAATLEKTRIDGEEGDVGWTFMDTHPRTGRNFITPMGNSVYNGMGGLAIFYLSLHRVSGVSRYLDDAERILCAMNKSQGYFASELSVGAYSGLTSYLYVLLNYQILTGRQTYQATIDELLLKLTDFPREKDELDFILGWCGAVTVLVNFYHVEKRETLLSLIEKLSQAIRSALILDDGTLLLSATGKPLLTGFSHGISGVLHALGKVWEVTKDPLLVELIAQWLRAENRLTVDGFWLDLRETAKSASTIKWCHGDGGILLARSWLTRTMGGALDADTNAVLKQDAERCERHLWEQSLGSGYSLCHGDFGNLMCLLKFYRDTNNEQGIAKVKRALSQVAHNFFNEDFLDERSIPDLGMMLGITGVGQALLHAVDAGLPDVLSLEFARPVAA